VTDPLAYARAYYRRPGVKEARAAWRDTNRERVRKQQRESHKRRVTLNPNFGKEARDRRRARLKGAKGSHTRDEWLLVIEAFGNCCSFCGIGGELVKDHLIPLCRGGTDWVGNLVPACAACNGTKGGREPKAAIKRLATPDRAERLYEHLEMSRSLPGNRERQAYVKVSSECLLAEARRIKEAFGKITAQLLNDHSRYASTTYERRFGGMRGLKILVI